MKRVSTIGLDLTKHVFQIHGADADGLPRMVCSHAVTPPLAASAGAVT